MARRPKNPINDIIDAAGAWLGGSKGSVTNPQVQAAMDATRAIGKVVDTATGGFGQAVVSDAQRMAASGSSTPSALYKTAAVNLGAAAAGVGAAKVAGKAGVAAAKIAGKAVESGVVARGVNKITKQQVIVHGGKVRGLQQIDPRAPYSGTDAAVFGVNPSFRLPAKTNPVSEPSRPLDFAKIAHGYATELKDSGSIYVAKVPKTSVKNRGSLGSKPSESIVISSAPAKVVAEIPVIPDERILLARRAEVIKAVKRAGAKVPKKK